MSKALACLALAAVALAQEGGLSGELPIQSQWQGEVEISGDVTVPKGGKLVVAAGTRVKLAGRDQLASGWHRDRVEIHVLGQIVIEGKLDNPVVFVPDDGEELEVSGSRVSWHGIVLHDRSDQVERRNQIRGTQFWRAFAAVQVPAGNALVEDCVFLSCSEGMQVGIANKSDRFVGAEGDIADPEIRRSRFVRCHTGIYATAMARAEVVHCVFTRCKYGVGCKRPGISFIQFRPGSRVIGCAFSDVGEGVVGSAVVRDSWFLNCRVALRLSDYHDRLATSVDHATFENNLAEDVEELVVGDTGAVRSATQGNLSPSSSLQALDGAWPPLPDCLILAEDSAGKGRGEGGRDLGPLSTSKLVAQGQLLPWQGGVQKGWLVAPADIPQGWPKIPAPQPGGKVGNRWWVSADADPQGVIHLKQVLGFKRKAGLLAFPFQTDQAGKVTMSWCGDVSALEVFLDGRSVLQHKSRRRFGAVEPPIELSCSKGAHVLLVQVEGWGVDPRWAISLLSGVETLTAKPDREVTFRVTAKRAGKNVVIQARPSVPLHFQPGEGLPLLAVVDQSGKVHPTDWEWSEAGAIEITAGPELPSKQDVKLVWKGVRDPLGVLLQIEPTMVRIP